MSYHFVHATLYTATFPVYALLTTTPWAIKNVPLYFGP